jgi:hypothetical protein
VYDPSSFGRSLRFSSKEEGCMDHINLYALYSARLLTANCIWGIREREGEGGEEEDEEDEDEEEEDDDEEDRKNGNIT